MNETDLENATLDRPCKQNLRKAEISGLKSLKTNRNIVIKRLIKALLLLCLIERTT